MKYEVLVKRIASTYICVEADTVEEAKEKALHEARSLYDFNNDDFPEYEVADWFQEED